MNSDKLVEHIIIISSVNPLSNTEIGSVTFKSAAVEHEITDADFLKTPNYFDCCSIENIGWGEKNNTTSTKELACLNNGKWM